MARNIAFSHRLLFVAAAALSCVVTVVARRSYADAHPGRYVVKPGIVSDTKTKLTWQQETAMTPYTWEEATNYCSALTLGGLDWRLPGVKELATLVDETRNDPAIDRAAFPNTPAKFFWTASRVTNFPTNAWTINFNEGGDFFFPMTMSQLVRCVH